MKYCVSGAFKVEVRTITYDFNDVKSYDIIEEQLKDLDIGVLGKWCDGK